MKTVFHSKVWQEQELPIVMMLLVMGLYMKTEKNDRITCQFISQCSQHSNQQAIFRVLAWEGERGKILCPAEGLRQNNILKSFAEAVLARQKWLLT